MGTPLDRDPYVSLLSWKRDGSGVETPVWEAPLDGKLVVLTLKDSFKVKRISVPRRICQPYLAFSAS